MYLQINWKGALNVQRTVKEAMLCFFWALRPALKNILTLLNSMFICSFRVCTCSNLIDCQRTITYLLITTCPYTYCLLDPTLFTYTSTPQMADRVKEDIRWCQRHDTVHIHVLSTDGRQSQGWYLLMLAARHNPKQLTLAQCLTIIIIAGNIGNHRCKQIQHQHKQIQHQI